VTIPPRRVVTLKASGQLKTQVNKAWDVVSFLDTYVSERSNFR
jgi:hypothetical protein